nr:hypothetical protein [uncultured Cohaesibacter sp.]
MKSPPQGTEHGRGLVSTTGNRDAGWNLQTLAKGIKKRMQD